MSVPIISKDGSCPKCQAPADKFIKALGGAEHCSKCGYSRRT